MSLTAESAAPTLVVNGTRIDMIERGSGRPLLFLHPKTASSRPLAGDRGDLARARASSRRRIRVSAAPNCPRACARVDDLSYFYLDLLDQLDLRDLTVVGVSLGAWIAAEIAVKSTARISRLVMADAVGIKVGDRETRDIADMFAITEKEFIDIAYCDPAPARATTRRCPTPRCSPRRAPARRRRALPGIRTSTIRG